MKLKNLRSKNNPMKNIIILMLFLATSKFAIAELSEDALGKNKGYPSCKMAGIDIINECKVGTFSNPFSLEDFYNISKVNPSTNPKKIKYASIETQKDISKKLEIERYLSKQRATGLMIVNNGEIYIEKYQYARTAEMQFKSFSMSKSIISLLIGIALEKSFIGSLDDKCEKYIPEIAGTVYGETTIRNFLRMSSGANFNEQYTNFQTNDLIKFFNALNFKPNAQYAIINNAKLFIERDFKQGSRFIYSSAATEFLSRIVTRATNKSITELTNLWLWEPIGAEDNAYWMESKSDNVAHGAGGFYATLRDYAKLAMMLANDGLIDGQQIISKQYLLEATDSELQPNGFKKKQAQYNQGYGYHFWLLPMRERTFAMEGIFGQNIFIQPSSKTIFIQTSVYERAAEDSSWGMQTDLFKEAIKVFGGNPY